MFAATGLVSVGAGAATDVGAGRIAAGGVLRVHVPEAVGGKTVIGELTVGEIVDATGFGQANASKHLNILRSIGFVHRRKQGLFVYHSLADKGVLQMCETMCGRLEADMRRRDKLLAG